MLATHERWRLRGEQLLLAAWNRQLSARGALRRYYHTTNDCRICSNNDDDYDYAPDYYNYNYYASTHYYDYSYNHNSGSVG